MPAPGSLSLAIALLSASTLSAATFTVTNTLDSGAGSLRAAIVAANASPGADTIEFTIAAAGVQTITPATALPDITSPVTIDGWSQTGFTNSPLIEISGAAIVTPNTQGLHLVAGSDNSIVRGLIVNRFDFGVYGDGSAGIYADGSGGDQFFGNWLGLAADGTSAGNAIGLDLRNSQDSVIGGTGANQRNVVGGNTAYQIRNDTSPRTVIRGNYVGIDPTGMLDRSDVPGVQISGSNDVIVGGNGAGEGNVISAGLVGLDISFLSTGNQVVGNIFGLGADGTTALGNSRANIAVSYTSPGTVNSITNNVIANATPDAVAGGDGAGVEVTSATRVLISRNSFRNNSGLAIDLDSAPVAFHGDGVTPNDPGDGDAGGNNLQNFPVVTSASQTGGTITVAGILNSIPSSTFTVELYSNAVCDPSGFGEGETYLGSVPVTTNASGNGTFNIALPGPATGFLTATATDAANNTSEFSACVAIVGGTVQLSSATYNGAEGSAVLVTVTRTGSAIGAATVDYNTTPGTASNADFTPVSGTLTWASGDSAPKSFLVPIANDGIAEPAESFTVNLSNPTGAVLGAPSTATVTIAASNAAVPMSSPLALLILGAALAAAAITVIRK
jgi:hypothetical protein